MNFESAEYYNIKNYKDLYSYIKERIIDKKVEEREKRSLLAINDNYRKVILTMDNVKNKQIDGIEVINIIDFLSEENH